MLLDEERLRNERKDRKSWKSRVNGIEETASSNGYPGRSDHDRRRPTKQQSGSNPDQTDDDDVEFRLALEASKNQAEEDKKRQSQNNGTDDDLAKAIKLSQEEEERRQRELEQTNADSLFDDSPAPPQQQQQQQQQQPQLQYQPSQQQLDYKQGQPIDLWGNPIDQQSTGYLNQIYAQPTAQFTGQQFPQPTGFDMQQAMQQQQMQQQQGYMAPLPTTQPAGFNPYATNGGLSPQQTAFLSPGNNNPYANGLQPAQPLQPLPTGSNNPFAPKMNYASQSPPRTGQPTLASLQEQRTQNFSQFQQQPQQQQQPQHPSQAPFGQPSFSSPSTPAPQAQQQQQQRPAKPIDPRHAQLEALLEGGNGLDTYGNTGDLRIPAQHTAPGMFVNSAGLRRGPAPSHPTGAPSNPYLLQNQFAGVPQTTGFGLQPQASRLVPAHTGPAGMNGGYNSSNPFGQPQPQQQPQQHQQQQQQDLIDF